MVKLSLPHPIPITNPTSPFRNFNFMRPIKIVGSDTDLHDYQVRIHLDRSNFPLEKCKPDGSDIRFRDDSGEILPYWIERWNAAEGVIWCKIPFIPAESSKFIWMIYGNPNAKSESNGNAVFELFDVQGIVGFWHMDEPQWTGATGEVKDETGVNHGTAYGGATTTSDAKYGRAGYFGGNDDYVELPSHITTAKTQEGWFYFSQLASDIGKSIYLFNNLYQHISNNYLYFTGTIDFFPWTPSLNTWYHIVITYTDPSNTYTAKLYINGAYTKSILQQSGEHDIDSIYRISSPSSNSFNGIIDEVRIYNRVLSPTEIQILSKNYMQKMGSYFNVRKYVTPAPVVIV